MNSPHSYKSPNAKCIIRIDDLMYDVTAWRGSHPGGVELIDRFHNLDATDVFYAFHSKDALAKLKRMTGKPVTDEQIPRDQVSKNYRVLFQKMVDDGWFDRNWFQDIFQVLLPCLLFNVIGTLIATSYPVLAAVLIGIGMQQAGWVAHDYCHSQGAFSKRIGMVLGAVVDGMSADWWNHKHNTHHSFTNRLQVDADIHNEPLLHIWFPPAHKDVWFRRYQHLYYLPVYSFLFASWRLQSIQFVLASKNWLERILLLIGYVWLACLPWKVAVASILISGWLVAVIVTCSHQAEDIIETDAKYNFIREQYCTTRGVVCPDPITEYLFGGMQYQLEHHLFPTLPKYRYAAVRPIVAQFAKENGLEFKTAGIVEIMKLNYSVMRKYAAEHQ